MSEKAEALPVGLSPTGKGIGEIFVDLDNGNLYFRWIRPSGERAPEPIFSSIVTIHAPKLVNCAVFPIDKAGARAAREMALRVRKRLGIAPKPELELTMRLYRENLERMLEVETEPKIRRELLLSIKNARKNEAKASLDKLTDAQTASPTSSPTSAPSSVEPPKKEPPRPKTRGEIVQEYADKVLAGEV